MVSSKGKKGSGKTARRTRRKEEKMGSESSTETLSPTESPTARPVSDIPPGVSQSNISFDHILDQVEEYAIILLDESGVILSWNKGAERIKGYKAADIIGKNYRIFYTQEDRDERLSEKLLERAREFGRTSYEGWRVRKDGRRFWGSMTLTALKSEDGSGMRFLKVTRDLTEKKMSEDMLSNSLEELKAKNEELKRSEERYHKMISEVRDYAIILLDPHGKVLDWNVGAEKVKGYPPAEIIGKSFRLFYPAEEKANKLPERLLDEAAEKGSTTHEGWRIRKDGTRFWGSVSITALHDDQGAIVGYSKVTRDLTDQKLSEDRISMVVEELRQMNDQLRQSEERYHKMIEEVQDYAIVLLNPAGEVQNWNSGASVIKGFLASEIIGKNFSHFYTQEDRERGLPQMLLAEARKHGKVVHEGWRVRKDGSRFWANVVITALHNNEGKIIGYSKVTRDLTERRRAEEALQASAAQLNLKNKTLERLNVELSSFSYVASHDLKEPLRKIQTFAGRIRQSGELTGLNTEFLQKITDAAARMQSLITDLLAYSEVSNDETKYSTVDLNEVVSNVVNDLEIAIHEKAADVQWSNLPVVRGIYHQFSQMFVNLISNSLKFSKKDEPPVIRIESNDITGPDVPGQLRDGANRYHQISFTDNGIGFDSEFSTKIFQAFQRLHSKQEFSGTGIGLAIVKKVVENHNGVVEAESTPGEGAIFRVYLPVEDV